MTEKIGKKKAAGSAQPKKQIGGNTLQQSMLVVKFKGGAGSPLQVPPGFFKGPEPVQGSKKK